MKDGTTYFSLLFAGATLPSLYALNHPSLASEWRHSDNPWTRLYWKSSLLTFSTKPSITIHSGPSSLILHTFHHGSATHWWGNVASIVASCFYLDLGFVKSTVLYVASSIGGVAALLAQRMWLDGSTIDLSKGLFSDAPASLLAGLSIPIFNGMQPEPLNDTRFSIELSTGETWLQNVQGGLDKLAAGLSSFSQTIQDHSPIRTLYQIHGASAAAFGFKGVECIWLVKYLAMGWTQRYPSRLARYRAEQDMAQTILYGLTTLVSISMMLDGFLVHDPQSPIGHAAHLGGFLVGLVCGTLWL
ncbi:hypothetical protein HDU91_003052 [Kappamyces sp. JEL0680]|nr:hypothetical protein HDU91_003052 [Kappamyces sp. JEL0680]